MDRDEANSEPAICEGVDDGDVHVATVEERPREIGSHADNDVVHASKVVIPNENVEIQSIAFSVYRGEAATVESQSDSEVSDLANPEEQLLSSDGASCVEDIDSQAQTQARAITSEVASGLTCAPLLSPFVGLRPSRVPSKTDMGLHLQRGRSLPSSSPEIPLSFSSQGLERSSSLNVLLSPFGGALNKSKNNGPGAVFSTSSSSPFQSLFVDRSEAEETCIVGQVDLGGLSSGDETVVGGSRIGQCLPITLSTKEDRNDSVCLSTNMEGDREGRNIITYNLAIPSSLSTETQTVCAHGDDVTFAYIHNERPGPLPVEPSSAIYEGVKEVSPMPDESVNMRPSTPTHSETLQVQAPITPSSSRNDSSIVSGASLKRRLDADSCTQAPAPKRMTPALRDKQHQKLASPFRSPLLARSDPSNVHICRISSTVQSKTTDFKTPNPSRVYPATNSSPLKNSFTSSAKASAQFKSPLKSSSSIKTSLRMNASKQIQDLERKVQLLKRANKIRKDDEEEKLEHLAQKWKQVGRDAAWDLWQIVRENEETTVGTGLQPGSPPSERLSSSWGWADRSSIDKTEENWSWDNALKTEEEINECDLESPAKLEAALYASLKKPVLVPRKSMLPPTPRGAYFEQQQPEERESELEVKHDMEADTGEGDLIVSNNTKSLGTMLLQLGIAHETLGWSEEEGDFPDT